MKKTLIREKVLTQLREKYEALERLIDEISEEEAIESGVQAHWSIKDILAHLTAWDKRGMKWISDALAGTPPAMPEPNVTWTGRHKLNEQTYQENLHIPFDTILDQYRITFNDLLELLEEMTDEEWHRLTPIVHKYGMGDPIPIGELAHWRLQHLITHSKPIEQWLKNRG